MYFESNYPEKWLESQKKNTRFLVTIFFLLNSEQRDGTTTKWKEELILFKNRDIITHKQIRFNNL